MERGFVRLAAALCVTLATAAGFATAPVASQAMGVPVALDARAEVAFPMGDFGDIVGTGAGFTVGAAVGLVPGFAVYGNYSQVRFGGGWTGNETSDATDSGFAVGLSAALPGTAGLDPWVGAGLLFHRLEVRGTRTGVSEDMGFEVGGGVAIPLTPRLRLSPAVNYRQYGASIPALAGLTARDLTVQYLSLGLGLNLSF
jgi:hypothetical protein